MKHPLLCNIRMCIDVSSHTQLTLCDVYKGLTMTYTQGRNYLPNNKQTSSKHAPDPLIARELHKQPVYILPLPILTITYNRKVVKIYIYIYTSLQEFHLFSNITLLPMNSHLTFIKTAINLDLSQKAGGCITQVYCYLCNKFTKNSYI